MKMNSQVLGCIYVLQCSIMPLQFVLNYFRKVLNVFTIFALFIIRWTKLYVLEVLFVGKSFWCNSKQLSNTKQLYL